MKSITPNNYTVLILPIYLILFCSITGCKKIENDTQAPAIIVLQPTNNETLPLGKDFKVVTIMNDFVSLSTYRYKVYWFDDPTNVSANPADPEFNLDKSGTITIDDDAPAWEDVSFDITIPNGIRKGYYKLDIYCYDKANNEGKESLLLNFQ
ncbi:MAG: DUF4625 domain-containing protein [Bacteroidetes bacterium]|nr:DUF4625 domain-containing protein [Bacteroidota bacterium]